MVESVDSQKVANHLDRAVSGLGRQPLKVLVQVNTSGEESKSGVEPSECLELAKHVKEECPNLQFSGFMTIGMLDYTSTPENFKTVANCTERVWKELDIPVRVRTFYGHVWRLRQWVLTIPGTHSQKCGQRMNLKVAHQSLHTKQLCQIKHRKP